MRLVLKESQWTFTVTKGAEPKPSSAAASRS